MAASPGRRSDARRSRRAHPASGAGPVLRLLVALAAPGVVAAFPGAADAQDVTVTSAVVATGVEGREPVDARDAFPANVGEVFFHTVLEGAFGERVVEHVWIRNGEEVGRVSLTVRGPRWRTWSSKTIPADWTGAWEARIVDSSGAVLASVPFRVGG